MDDTSIVAAIEEEKLSRSAGTGGIPRLAVPRCLEQANSKIQDIQIVAFPLRPRISALREAGFHFKQGFSGAGPTAWIQSLGQTFRQVGQLRQMRHLYSSSGSFLFLDHHLCHAASAYYASPFERALVLTLDERGDMHSGSLYLGEGDELRLLKTLRFPNSLGWFFSRVTNLLGLRPRRDEHKVQWLSKEGQPDFLPALRKVFHWNADGLPVLNKRYLGSGAQEDAAFSETVLRELGLEPRSLISDPQARASLARSARDVLEEIVLNIVERYRKQHSADCLCAAGGLFLNVFLVRALETCSGFRQVYVQPVARNSGAALGAALLARKRLGRPARQPLNHLYLGPGFPSGAIKAVLDNCKIIYKYPAGEEQLFPEAAHILSRDKLSPGSRDARSSATVLSATAAFWPRRFPSTSSKMSTSTSSTAKTFTPSHSPCGRSGSAPLRLFCKLPVHGFARKA